MRKFFKVLLLIVAGLVVIVGVFAAFVAMRGLPTHTAQKPPLKIEYTPQRIENGTKLASMLCRGCHLNSESGKFTGRELSEVTQFGKIFSKNITKDAVAGIGRWTDSELIYFLRTGVRPDGQYIPPYMPKLVNISDEDMYSIIAFLRSDNNWVAPAPTEYPELKPSFLTKFLCTIGAFKPFPYPKQAIAGPDTTNEVQYGKYIALYQLECFSCHSKDFAKNDYYLPENSEGFFGGGNEMFDMEGHPMKTLNITMDEKNGIGSWTEDQFIQAVKFGKHPTEYALRYPMQPYSNLTDKEAKAIYAYLKTVPKSSNKVERVKTPDESITEK